MNTKRRVLILLSAASVGGSVVAAVPMQPAGAATSRICDISCDGADPAQAQGNRPTVTSTLFGRTVSVHVNDPGAMAWARIENASPGDRVWLERSFDGGQTVTDGGLGDTTVAGGRRDARSAQFNVDDGANRRVGAVRACGRAGDRPEQTCTPWTRNDRNASTRSTAAATALMMRYDQSTGLFGRNTWWTSANALTSIIDNMSTSHMASYRYAIANTYDKQVNSHQGQFRNEFLDDTGWWGLAWIDAYDATKDPRYLQTARADADWMQQYWDTTCGGGVWWKTDKKQKNAIENSLYIQLNAELATRLPDGGSYLDRAKAGWNWFRSSGLVNGDHLVNDGIDTATCRNNGGQTWTYNQGVLVNGLSQLNRATPTPDAVTVARQVADATTSAAGLSPDGILTEPPNGDDCNADGSAFKGPAVRGISALNASTGGAYSSYLKANADSAEPTRDTLNQYGFLWRTGGDGSKGKGVSCQMSALDLMNAAER